MRNILDGSFDLLIGFGSVHIMIYGLIAGIIGAVLSVVVWLMRGQVLRALPGLVLVLLVPLMVLQIVPGGDLLAVPITLICLVLSGLSHFRPPEGRKTIDTILVVILGLALIAFAVAQILLGGAASPGGDG